MKLRNKDKIQGSTNFLLRVGGQNNARDSFFYRKNWQIIRRFLFCFLYSLSVLPLWMISFNLEVDLLSQSLILVGIYALIYLFMRFSKRISSLVILLLTLGIIGALVPELPVLSSLGWPLRSVGDLLYNRLSYGLGLERELMEAGLAASAGFVVVLALFVALILLWRPLPLLGFLFSSILFAFAEEITEHASVNKMQLSYVASILLVLLIWSGGEYKHRLEIRPAKPKIKVSDSNELSRRKRAVPISVIILAVLMLLNSLIPASAFYVKRFDDYMSRLFGQRYREPSSISYLQFSLRDLGYYPLENRLGGTPDLDLEPYMYIDSDSASIHLRGTAYVEYTGLGWTQDGMNPNWLMGHSRNVEAQKQILGELHDIEDGQVQLLMPDRYFELRPIREQQVIFHGGRPSEFVSLDSSSFNVYFNQSGNLYLDKRISRDGYRGLGQWFSVREMSDQENLDSLLGLIPEARMSEQDKLRWLALPQLPELKTVLEEKHPELNELIYGFGFNETERVTSIRSYLAENFTYTLNVEMPPDDREFVAYFLESGEGYCTYFATAFTVLLRSAGIPARYVEGFLVPKSGTNTTRELSGENGHAWTEVWLDGLGWIPLDATPSSILDSMDNSAGGGEADEQTQTTESRPDPTESEASPEQQEIEEQTEEDNFPGADNDSFSFSHVLLLILKILLYILLFSSPFWIFILWRYWVYRSRHDSEYLQKLLEESSIEDLIAKIDLDLRSMWNLEGRRRQYGETIREFVLRVSEGDGTAIDQVYLDLTEKIYYADPDEKLISRKELAAFLDFYDSEERRLKNNLPRKTWFFKRFLWSAYHPLPR